MMLENRWPDQRLGADAGCAKWAYPSRGSANVSGGHWRHDAVTNIAEPKSFQTTRDGETCRYEWLRNAVPFRISPAFEQTEALAFTIGPIHHGHPTPKRRRNDGPRQS